MPGALAASPPRPPPGDLLFTDVDGTLTTQRHTIARYIRLLLLATTDSAAVKAWRMLAVFAPLAVVAKGAELLGFREFAFRTAHSVLRGMSVAECQAVLRGGFALVERPAVVGALPPRRGDVYAVTTAPTLLYQAELTRRWAIAPENVRGSVLEVDAAGRFTGKVLRYMDLEEKAKEVAAVLERERPRPQRPPRADGARASWAWGDTEFDLPLLHSVDRPARRARRARLPPPSPPARSLACAHLCSLWQALCLSPAGSPGWLASARSACRRGAVPRRLSARCSTCPSRPFGASSHEPCAALCGPRPPRARRPVCVDPTPRLAEAARREGWLVAAGWSARARL